MGFQCQRRVIQILEAYRALIKLAGEALRRDIFHEAMKLDYGVIQNEATRTPAMNPDMVQLHIKQVYEHTELIYDELAKVGDIDTLINMYQTALSYIPSESFDVPQLETLCAEDVQV